MAKLLDFMFLEGRYSLNCNNTELKRVSEIKFSVSERHRWAASLGGTGLMYCIIYLKILYASYILTFVNLMFGSSHILNLNQ